MKQKYTSIFAVITKILNSGIIKNKSSKTLMKTIYEV
jgi:hypothetical protein